MNPETYKIVPRDSTAKIVRKTNALIKQSTIPTETQKRLTSDLPTYVKESRHLVNKLKTITLSPEDTLVRFDVVSLFINGLQEVSLTYIDELFPKDIAALFRHVLTTTYFQWNDKFYQHQDGVGSPLSPVIANFYMEKFEQLALRIAKKRPEYWLRYLGDTFVVWRHGETELNKFLTHLSSIHPKIQFTMKNEQDRQLAFLDVFLPNQNTT